MISLVLSACGGESPSTSQTPPATTAQPPTIDPTEITGPLQGAALVKPCARVAYCSGCVIPSATPGPGP
jgi:hypothetical protein